MEHGTSMVWQGRDPEGIRLLKIVSEKLQSQWNQLFCIEEESKTRMRSYKIGLERFTVHLETNSSGGEEESLVTCIVKILK